MQPTVKSGSGGDGLCQASCAATETPSLSGPALHFGRYQTVVMHLFLFLVRVLLRSTYFKRNSILLLPQRRMRQMWPSNPDRWKDVENAPAVIALLLGLLVLLLLIGRSANGTYNAGIILTMVLDGVLIGLVIVHMLVVRHTSRQRVLARRNAQEVIAAAQPIADAHALPLPTTIELRVVKAKYILYQAVCFALVYTIIMSLADSQGPFSLRRFLLTLLLSFLMGGLLGLLNFYLAGRQMEQTLVIDDQGISILHSRENIHIDWQAARFFGVHRDRKSDTTGLYELSNETSTVAWRWFPPIITNPFNFLRLTIPYDEYTHTMAALLSVVEGRTHLPLHDLHDYKARNT